MFVLFKFAIFCVLRLRHLIRLKLPDFFMVFTFCLIYISLFLFWHFLNIRTVLCYAGIIFPGDGAILIFWL